MPGLRYSFAILAMAALACPSGAMGGAEPAGSGSIREMEFPTPRCGPSIVAKAPDGSIWVALARAGRLGRIQGEATREFPLPDGAFPVGIAIDPDGVAWYSDINRNAIGRLDPGTGAVREFAVPTPNAWPFFLVLGRDGALWFTERVGNRLGRLDPMTGEVTEIAVPTSNCQPAGLAVTPQGWLYFTENSANRIGRYRPDTGQMSEIPIPTPATPGPFYGPAGIAVSPSGDVWFCQLDGRLGRIRPGSESIEEYQVPRPGARPAGVAIDRWGTVWFTQIDANSIGCFYPDLGAFREFAIPSGRPDARPMGPPEVTARGERPSPGPSARTSRPFGIACDDEGRVWFSEQYAHKVGILTCPPATVFGPSGRIDVARVPIRVGLRTPSGTSGGPRFLLDGREVPADNELDLSRTCSGRHTFALELPTRPPTWVESEFVFSPSLATLASLARAQQADGILPAFVAEGLERACALARSGRTDLGREVVRALIRRLTSAGTSAEAGRSTTMLSHLRFYDRFAQRSYEVAATGIGFEPAELVLEVGDEVVIRNQGGGPLHVEGPDGEVPGADLAPGGALRHRFHREGAYGLAGAAASAEFRGRVRVATRTIEVLEFPMAGPGRVPTVLDIDRDGNVWFTAGGGGFSKLADVPLNNKIGRLSRDGTIREYETPTLESAPTSLKVDPRGRIWFTERGGNNIGCLDPATGRVVEYPIPTPLAGATGLAIDAEKRRVWFTEKKASKYGYLDWSSGRITEFDTPTAASIPSTIALDRDGYVWFDERGSDNLIRHNPATREVRKHTVPTPRSRVVGITPDGEGRIWFLELGGHKVGRLDVQSGLVREYAIPTPLATPFKLAIDARGRIWFTEVFGNKIGVLDPRGSLLEFAIPARDCMPGGIVIDAEGNVWFAEQAANRIAMIPQGALFTDDACDRTDARNGPDHSPDSPPAPDRVARRNRDDPGREPAVDRSPASRRRGVPEP